MGINGTRLFTVLYGGKALKVGRVQTPTLAMLVDRESKIMNFKKEAYYMAHIMGNGLDAVSEHISDKTEAERIAGACENGQALVTSVVKEEKWVAPPKLYDLTTLQRDANRLFGFTAKQTLEYTQSLYEKKLVTYPRTDSQYLSDDMEGTAKNVIEAIFNSLLFEQNIMFNPDIKRILNSKKVTDHHAIIPTMEIIKQDLKAIPESEMKILSLCANRLLCATGEKHIYNSTKAVITCNNTVFKVSGKEVWKNGWKEFEDFFKNSYKTTEDKSDAEEEKKLPELLCAAEAAGALMIFDLDKFKQINDTLGHPEGDLVLQKFARCLLEVFGSDNFVARLGGDEFIVYSDDTLTQEAAAQKARQLIDKMALQMGMAEKRCGLAVSIGIAFYPSDAGSLPELVKLADRALYRAKHNDGKCYMFYSEIK